jgi:hypothetical protein
MQRQRQIACTCTIVSLFAAVGARPVQAQKSMVQFGLEGGVTLANNVGADAAGSSGRTSGFGGGTVIVQRAGSPLGFQTGLLLVGKGSKIDSDGIAGAIRLRYLEVPLLLRYVPVTSQSGVSAAITAGVTVGARVSCNVQGRADGISVSANCASNELQDFVQVRRAEVGLAVGGELVFPVGNRLALAPMVRYTRGVTSVSSGSSNDRVYNGVVHLGIGLRSRR